jgi:hypothetical protein
LTRTMETPCERSVVRFMLAQRALQARRAHVRGEPSMRA